MHTPNRDGQACVLVRPSHSVVYTPSPLLASAGGHTGQHQLPSPLADRVQSGTGAPQHCLDEQQQCLGT
jgi:hypothetical protein